MGVHGSVLTIEPGHSKTRQEKAKRIADLGSPIKLRGQALDMLVRGNSLWVAENTGSVLVIDLNVRHLGLIARAKKTHAVSLDEWNELDVQLSSGTCHHFRLRGQNSRLGGWEDNDHWFVGQSIGVANSCPRCRRTDCMPDD